MAYRSGSLRCVHGEPAAAQALRDAIATTLQWPATVPAYGETYALAGAAQRVDG